MGKFLDHLLLSGLQIAHVDFTWPGYGRTSLIVVFGLSFYNVSRKGFTALFSQIILSINSFNNRSGTIDFRFPPAPHGQASAVGDFPVGLLLTS